jgi:hypothetical protein
MLAAMVTAASAEPVHFKQLMPFVDIQLPGWAMDGKPQGTTLKQGNMQMSEARATFRSGEKTLEIVIMDFWGQTIPWLGTALQLEMETSDEVIRTIEVQGFKALETFRTPDKHGELNISVSDRFWVRIEGEGLANTDPLKAAAAQMDLKKLATLGK